MTTRPGLLLLALLLAFAGLGFAPSARAADGGDAGRQLLMMLRLPPDHLRPGTDYAGGYGDGMGRAARRRIAGRIARAHGLTLVDDWPMPLVGMDCFVLSAPAGSSTADLAATLSNEPDVAWSQPMGLYQAQAAATHNDPLFQAQPVAREWRLAELHQTVTGRNVRVAVIDSKVDASHPDLAGQIVVSQDFITGHVSGPEQHGTNVAGVIAAKADNRLGIAGVAPRARLMALRACWQTVTASGRGTVCDSLSLAKALSYAIGHSAQVINLSLAGPPDLLLGRLLDVAHERGVTVVGAYDRSLPDGGFPASHPGVVAVAEVGAATPVGVFSAPGRDVPTTEPGGRWGLASGSSISAAQVSGLFALLKERRKPGAGSLALVSARDGQIDACATLALGGGGCANTAVVRR